MLRRGFVFLCLLGATVFTYPGCRSCSSCHDYDPPVANCGAGGCGCHRAGSVSGHSPPGEYGGAEYAVEAQQDALAAPPDATEAPMDMSIEAPTPAETGEMP